MSSIALDAGDFDTIAALAPTLRALCVSYSGFTLTPKRVIARVAVPRSLARLALYDRDWHPGLSPTLAKSHWSVHGGGTAANPGENSLSLSLSLSLSDTLIL